PPLPARGHRWRYHDGERPRPRGRARRVGAHERASHSLGLPQRAQDGDCRGGAAGGHVVITVARSEALARPDAVRRAVAAVIAVALAVASGVLGATGSAGTAVEPPSPADASAPPPLSASLVSIAPSYLTSSTSLSVRVALTAGASNLSGVQTVVSVTESPLATASAVDVFLAQPDREVVREVGRGQPAEFLQ